MKLGDSFWGARLNQEELKLSWLPLDWPLCRKWSARAWLAESRSASREPPLWPAGSPHTSQSPRLSKEGHSWCSLWIFPSFSPASHRSLPSWLACRASSVAWQTLRLARGTPCSPFPWSLIFARRSFWSERSSWRSSWRSLNRNHSDALQALTKAHNWSNQRRLPSKFDQF